MEEKKLDKDMNVRSKPTDEEIIQALKKQPPYDTVLWLEKCINATDILDLIRRLQGVNEDLKAKQKCHLELIDEKTEEIHKQKAEIERLTEERDGARTAVEQYIKVNRQNLDHFFKEKKAELQKQVDELKNKIEQRTLIELPCKVGDTVYVIIKAENGYALLKDICDGFMIKDGEVFIGLQTYNVVANKYYFTREEAEKRLKELQE